MKTKMIRGVVVTACAIVVALALGARAVEAVEDGQVRAEAGGPYMVATDHSPGESVSPGEKADAPVLYLPSKEHDKTVAEYREREGEEPQESPITTRGLARCYSFTKPRACAAFGGPGDYTYGCTVCFR